MNDTLITQQAFARHDTTGLGELSPKLGIPLVGWSMKKDQVLISFFQLGFTWSMNWAFAASGVDQFALFLQSLSVGLSFREADEPLHVLRNRHKTSSNYLSFMEMQHAQHDKQRRKGSLFKSPVACLLLGMD